MHQGKWGFGKIKVFMDEKAPVELLKMEAEDGRPKMINGVKMVLAENNLT